MTKLFLDFDGVVNFEGSRSAYRKNKNTLGYLQQDIVHSRLGIFRINYSAELVRKLNSARTAHGFLNLLALAFAALTVLSTVVLLLFVVQARKKQQAALQSAIQVLLPLVRKKYDLDVNADLLESLMSGANLPLFMQGEITRVGLRNLRKQAILVVFETVEESEDSITAE